MDVMENAHGSERDYLIKDVAVYLRKSRGDADTDLENHRYELSQLCRKYGLRYKEFSEVGTSDSIEDRPKFMQLLEEVKQGLYDAIAVIDIDRLGRGNDEDWGRIERILRENEMRIITPSKIYDLENDDDEFQLDFKKFFARVEYKQISKRLRRGKILGAKRGHWTNGRPPYPYFYNSEMKCLEVDDEKRKVYLLIKERALCGYSTEKIAWELNKLGFKSPGGKHWSPTAVHRLLFDKTHMGKIVFGKQKGSGHKNKKTKPLKKIAEEDWVVVDADHEVLKTEEEHARLVEVFAKRKIVPKASRRGAFLFSGLVYCGQCGHSMQFTYNGKSDMEYVKKCQTKDHLGNRCGNRGIPTQLIIERVFQALEETRSLLKSKAYDVTETELTTLKDAIEQKKRGLVKEERALDTLQEQREDGEISKERFLQRKEIREDNIQKLRSEIMQLKARCNAREEASDQSRLEKIEEFHRLWNSTDNTEDRNRFLKLIVDKITYTRNGTAVDMNINFV